MQDAGKAEGEVVILPIAQSKKHSAISRDEGNEESSPVDKYKKRRDRCRDKQPVSPQENNHVNSFSSLRGKGKGRPRRCGSGGGGIWKRVWEVF